MIVNEWKFDGIVIDDKIEGVSEEQKVACPPTVSIERGGHGRLSAAAVCVHCCGGGDLWQNANIPDDGRRFWIAAESESDRLHAGCISLFMSAHSGGD